MDVPSGLDRAALEKAVNDNPEIKALLEGKNIVKTIVVPEKLVNYVVK